METWRDIMILIGPHFMIHHVTGKFLSEALFFALSNPQYDDRLYIELPVQYMKITSLNLGRTCCVQKLFLTLRTGFVHNMFSPCSAKRRASDKNLPVTTHNWFRYFVRPIIRKYKICQFSWQISCYSLVWLMK